MGYMGFGMNKAVYTRKPKKPFSHLKKVYGEKLEMLKHDQQVRSPQATQPNPAAVRKLVEAQIRYNFRMRLGYWIGGLAVLALTIWWLSSILF
jgi:ribosomal protein S12